MRTLTFLAVLLVSLSASVASACSDDDADSKTVTVITHDSFNITKDLLADFEKSTGLKVKLLPKGDAGAMLTSVILSKKNPEGDAVFGVDNTFLSRALDEDIFAPYSSPLLNKVPNDLQAEGGNRVTPIDYGYVNFNYDIDALKKANLEPPKTLEDLTDAKWKGKVVVENPATSSPGLAFLIATVDYFGADKYLDWWKKMRANGLVVADGWGNTLMPLIGGLGLTRMPVPEAHWHPLNRIARMNRPIAFCRSPNFWQVRAAYGRFSARDVHWSWQSIRR